MDRRGFLKFLRNATVATALAPVIGSPEIELPEIKDEIPMEDLGAGVSHIATWSGEAWKELGAGINDLMITADGKWYIK